MRVARRSMAFSLALFALACADEDPVGHDARQTQSGLSAADAATIGGFEGPLFGLATAPNGDLLVPDAATGVLTIRNGAIASTIPLAGVTDVDPIGRGSLWAVTGAGDDATTDSGQGLHRVAVGNSRMLVNLFAFEVAQNPDGNDPPDSNPFDVQSAGGRAALVADAGGNDLLRVNNQGDVEALALFPDELVSTANAKDLAGCPDPSPGSEFVCDLPEAIPAQPVPTSIALGPDNSIYVGELKGFPAPTDESNIWRVAPGASSSECGASPDCVKVFDGGFTSIIDLAWGPDGLLYVVELDEASWLSLEGVGTPLGGTINACDVAAGTCVDVVTDVPIVTAITFGKDGSLWATRNALVPGSAEVAQIP